MTRSPAPDSPEHASQSGHRRRALNDRHLRFIAIGGAIGAGLFLASGQGIATAGPALLLAYAICGVVVFFVARALGEMTVHDPVPGAFSTYAERYLGDTAGFVAGWTYWLNWVLVGAAEITAVGVFMKFWFPELPQWIPALCTLIFVLAVNLRAVRIFGEVEFWLALIKIVVIVGLISLCAVALFLPALLPIEGAGFQNLWQHGGFFPHGAAGLIAALPSALFAFGGVEVIGLMAAETEDPRRSIPRAINGVVLRIGVFYMGAMVAMMSLMPWTNFSGDVSPFVMALTRLGIPAAAALINFVAITAVVSSCNTGLFASARMLASLSERGQAPSQMAPLDSRGLPRRAILLSALCWLGVVFLNWLTPEKIFGLVMTTIAFQLLAIWLIILLSHRAFRRASSSGSFLLPGFPYSTYLAIAFMGFAAVLLAREETSRLAFYMTMVWLLGLVGVHVLARRRKRLFRPETPTASRAGLE